MKRSSFRTGKEAQRRAAEKKARPKNLVTKRLGKSAVKKGPWRSDEHKRRVVACGCMVRRASGYQCWGPVDPHHVTLWRKGWGQPSDALVVPLCRRHHDEAHEGDGGQRGFEKRYGIKFGLYIERLTAVGANAIAAIRAAGGEI